MTPATTPPGALAIAQASAPCAEQVPRRSKFAWALGSLGDNYASQTLQQLAFPVFNIGLGLSAERLATALAIPRWLDSFADPTIGYLSDNSRNRFGRRRPFILAGAVPLAILAYAIWLLGSGWSETSLAWYVSALSLLYYLAYALFVVPYRALGFELTADYNERTRIQGWGMIFGLLGGLGIPWLYSLVLIFGGANPHATAIAPETVLSGARWVGLAVGVIILVTCSAPALFCRERVRSGAQEKIAVFPALRETLANRAFVNMLFSRTLVLVGTFGVSTLNTPLMVYYLYGGNQFPASKLQGIAGNLQFIGAAIGIPFHAWFSARVGKRHAFLTSLAVAAAGSLSQLVTYQPSHPYWILGSFFCFGFGVQGVWLMCQSMVADVCDEDETRTRRRREGIYGAAYSLLEKLGVTLGLCLAGMLATRCGYTAGTPTPEALHLMWLATILLPVGGMAVAAGVIYFYPLTQLRMKEIRRELETRAA